MSGVLPAEKVTLIVERSEAARATVGTPLAVWLADDTADLARSHEALRAERDRLRRVLDEYGQHKEDCAIEIELARPSASSFAPGDCDCGFDQATYVALGLVKSAEGES